MRGLQGRRALVTGAARGLGEAMARRLLEEGCEVAILDRDAAATAHAVKALGALGNVIGVEADVRDASSVKAALDQVESRLGGLEILVNNAGVVRDGPLQKMTDDDWDAVLEINLRGYFVCCREALALLRESGHGRIVNISSRAHKGNPGQANYSAAKAGVVGLTKALSLELGRDGITVNAVAPGMIDTDLVRNHPKSDAIVARAVKNTPVGRIGQPEDVAAAVAFLASADSGYISGEVIHVSGGRA